MATAKSTRKIAKKTAPEVEPEVAARNRENAAARIAGKSDTHDANPDNPTDSSVRHAEPPTGHRTGEGHGGYPSGEYDVTKPAPSGVQTKGVEAGKDGLPVGTVIEQEAEKRWRVHVPGQNQFGHGATMDAAIADYFAPPTTVAPAE